MTRDNMTRDDVIRSTAQHIRRVGDLMLQSVQNILNRAVHHDQTKWSEQEWPLFEVTTPKLSGLTYGSDEYKKSLEEIRPALEHHYANNSHHPQYFKNGIDDMSLLDLIEMICDWRAAGERHEDGSMLRSLTINKERFKISDQLFRILENTVKELNF